MATTTQTTNEIMDFVSTILTSLLTLPSDKLDKVSSMLGKIVAVIKSPEHGEDGASQKEPEATAVAAADADAEVYAGADTATTDADCVGDSAAGNGDEEHKEQFSDAAADAATTDADCVGADATDGGSPQKEPLTANMLASASPDQQNNMIGDRLYPLIHTVQPDLAGKITGMFLEMDNSDLLVLLNAPDALNSKIQEAIDVLADYAADEDDGNGTNETNSVGAATAAAAASPATDHGEEEHKESDAEASAKELVKEVATSVLSSDGTDAAGNGTDAGAAGNRKWVKAASQDPTEKAVWQIARAKKKREMTENARKLNAAAAEAREKCKSKRQGYDAMRKPCPGQFEGCLKFRWRDPITRETKALCCACHHENMRQERQRQQQLKEEWYTARYRCPCHGGKDGCMEWRFYDRDQDVVLPLCQACSR